MTEKKVKSKKGESKAAQTEKVVYAGTGRRKTSIAKVWISPGAGKIWVNHQPAEKYFQNRAYLVENLLKPLVLTGNHEHYNVRATALGGGIASQAFAVRMGIARSLLQANPDFRVTLKKAGLLTRDPRMKERKKYGHKRARKSFQYSKR